MQKPSARVKIACLPDIVLVPTLLRKTAPTCPDISSGALLVSVGAGTVTWVENPLKHPWFNCIP